MKWSRVERRFYRSGGLSGPPFRQRRTLVRHAAFRGGSNEAHVLREHASCRLRRWRNPRFPSSRQFLIAHIDAQEASGSVDRDAIAVLHERDRTAFLSFRRDVADDEAVRSCRETAVGEQRDISA